jgi:hypothetical protein
VVAVTSGANMNFDRLRLVSELAQIGARREAMLATSIPEVTSRRAAASLVRCGAQHLGPPASAVQAAGACSSLLLVLTAADVFAGEGSIPGLR